MSEATATVPEIVENQGRTIYVSNPFKKGTTVARKSLIQHLFINGTPEGWPGMKVQKGNRGQIVKFLEEVCNHECSFQVVFQATNKNELQKIGSEQTSTTTTRSGKKIVFDGKEQFQTDVIRDLLRGSDERPKMSRQGVVRALKEQGIKIAYGTVYQASKKLKDEGIEVLEETGTRGGSGMRALEAAGVQDAGDIIDLGEWAHTVEEEEHTASSESSAAAAPQSGDGEDEEITDLNI